MNPRAKINELFYGPNYKWLVIGLLFLARFLNLEDRVVVFSVLPLIKKELHMSDLEVGALMTVFLWVYALGSPLAGFLGDHVSRRRVVIGSLFLWNLVTLAAGFVTSAGQLMATRVLLGLTQAFYIPASLAILGDCHDAQTRGKAVAIMGIGMNLGPIVGGGMAGWIGDHYGWRPTLIILGAAGIGLALILFVLLREVVVGASEEASLLEPAQSDSFAATLKELASTPSYLILIFAVAVFSLAAWMLATWLPMFMYESFGMNLAQSGFLGNLAITGPAFVGALLGGSLSDMLGRDKPKNRMILMLCCYGLTIPWPVLFRAAGSAAVVLASAFLFQLCRALGESNCFPIMYELVSPQKRSTATGISNSVNTIFAGAGALLVGYFTGSIGFPAVFGMVPVLIAFAVAGLLVSSRLYLDKDLCRAAGVRGGTASEIAHQPTASALRDIGE